MRAYVIFSRIVSTIIDQPEHKAFIKILRAVEVFYYMAVILYEQYFVIRFHPKETDELFVYRAKMFMIIEVTVFYSLIISTILFLLFIQCRGVLGFKNYEMNRHRFIYDALDYYESDIIWVQFQIAPIILNLIVVFWDEVFNKNFRGEYDDTMMMLLLTNRCL